VCLDQDAKEHLPSVLMLFTHCDGFASHAQVLALLNRIGRSKALPEDLLPFLRHAIQLLTAHGDDLLVLPAEDDAQRRMGVVRKLLQCSVKPMTDTGAALQCPLSEDVRKSLELACERKKAEIMHGRCITDYTNASTQARTRTSMHARTHTLTHSLTYTHIHTHIHAHPHTQD
jgi:hypothetical protein